MATAEQLSLTNRQAIGQIVGPFKSRMAIFGLCTFGVGLLEAFFLVVVTRTGLAIAEGTTTVGVTRGVEATIGEAIGLSGFILIAGFPSATSRCVFKLASGTESRPRIERSWGWRTSALPGPCRLANRSAPSSS